MHSTVTSAKKCPEKYVPYGPLSDNVSNGFLDSYGVIREAYKGVVITVHCLPIPYVHTCMLTIGCAPSLAYISCMPCLSLLPFSTGGLCCPHPLKCGELPSRGGESVGCGVEFLSFAQGSGGALSIQAQGHHPRNSFPSLRWCGWGGQSTTCDVPVQQEMATVVSLGNAPHVPKMMHLPHT